MCFKILRSNKNSNINQNLNNILTKFRKNSLNGFQATGSDSGFLAYLKLWYFPTELYNFPSAVDINSSSNLQILVKSYRSSAMDYDIHVVDYQIGVTVGDAQSREGAIARDHNYLIAVFRANGGQA